MSAIASPLYKRAQRYGKCKRAALPPHPASVPHAIRCLADAHAASYAHHMLRESGGRVVVMDSTGYAVIAEHVEAAGSGLRLLNEYRVRQT